MGSSSKSYEVVRTRDGGAVQLIEKTKLKSGKITRRTVSVNAIRSKARARPASAKRPSPSRTPVRQPSRSAGPHRASAKKHMKWPKWQPTLTPILSASFSELPIIPQTMMPGLPSRPVSPRRSPAHSPKRSPKAKKTSFFSRATARFRKKGVVSALKTPF